jgi:LysR family transcriptional regulator (chromosome initiation inhibitor)
MGWALNPVALAGPHLAAGRLVELVPGQGLEVPLYWQHVRLGTRVLELLTRKVAAAARAALVRDAA